MSNYYALLILLTEDPYIFVCQNQQKPGVDPQDGTSKKTLPPGGLPKALWGQTIPKFLGLDTRMQSYSH